MNWAASIHQVAALTTMPALGDCQIGEGEIRLFFWSLGLLRDTQTRPHITKTKM